MIFFSLDNNHLLRYIVLNHIIDVLIITCISMEKCLFKEYLKSYICKISSGFSLSNNDILRLI